MKSSSSERRCVLKREDAAELAEPFSRFDDKGELDLGKIPSSDPFKKEIEASLLSSHEIRKYVEKTGLISPFFVGGGKESLLKDASYEGRIGSKAFYYKPNENKPTQIFSEGGKVLLVRANTIVFVECDLDFRLPEFIALRFNLQIKHVHRGLLLGTGPLIDPGYCGKLCIPLHNLTDVDYEIPFDEGLIWIEFTRISVDEQNRIGRPPLGKTFWKIEDFLTKASQPFDQVKEKVGIRSAIPAAMEVAAKDAREAKVHAEKARSTITKIGIGGAIVGGVALAALIFSLVSLSLNYYSDMNSQFEIVRPQISQLRSDMDELKQKLTREQVARETVERENAKLRERIQNLEKNQATPPKK